MPLKLYPSWGHCTNGTQSYASGRPANGSKDVGTPTNFWTAFWMGLTAKTAPPSPSSPQRSVDGLCCNAMMHKADSLRVGCITSRVMTPCYAGRGSRR
jgi:hypothetical protein